MLFQIVVVSNSKISCLNVAFSLVAGPQKILTVHPKMSTQFLFNFFKQNLLFSLFKSEKLREKQRFPLYRSKTVLPISGKWKKILTNFNFEFYFLQFFFDV